MYLLSMTSVAVGQLWNRVANFTWAKIVRRRLCCCVVVYFWEATEQVGERVFDPRRFDRLFVSRIYRHINWR